VNADLPISTEINAERIVLLGWARAILLQLAHPLVAAGVAEHSSFREGRLTAAVRLHHTVRAMLSLTFGSDAERTATLARINGIHRRVNGVLGETVGRFAAGTRYSAEDPALLLWVHATLLDSIPLVYERLVAPLSEAERDQYCVESAPVVHALGARTGEPRSWRGLGDYMQRMYASGTLTVGAQARELARAVLAPPLAWTIGPAARINWLFTVGLLPPALREQYGFTWSTEDARALERWTARLRGLRQVLPRRVALWPEARQVIDATVDQR
jgi:uncharacterized protein (DUF2236 family)